MRKQHFSYAVQIQPQNGQELIEHRDGIKLHARRWTPADRNRFPQAERQLFGALYLDWVLVVDTRTNLVYKVPVEESHV